MSTIERLMSDLRIGQSSPEAARMAELLPQVETSIVPRQSISGRALVAVVAIMTFLASLTTGAVMLVRSAANDWQSDVAREVTIQLRPTAARDIEAEVRRTVEFTRGFAGVADVRALSKDESARLLEPWLGTGLALDDLPVPRMIIVRLAPGRAADLPRLRQTLAERFPGASLDDHRAWIERMRDMAQSAVLGGIGILILMLSATVLSVAFASHGAMATNRPIVEVLHFIGAKDSFIASQFQRHFLVLGLEGGVLGGGLAIMLFGLAGIFGGWSRGTPGYDQLASLFGAFELSLEGYIVIVVQIALMAVVAATTSRYTVNRTLAAVE